MRLPLHCRLELLRFMSSAFKVVGIGLFQTVEDILMQNYIIRVMRQQQFHLKFLAYLEVGKFQGLLRWSLEWEKSQESH